MQVHFTCCPAFVATRDRQSASTGGLPAAADFRAIQAAGFDRIALHGAEGLEAFEWASAALAATHRLEVILPCRPSAASPTASVRRIAALAGRADGRLALFAEPERLADGKRTHQAMLGRLDEYLKLLDQLWLNDRPIDHEGEHYRLHRAFIGDRLGGAAPAIHMGGVTGTALQVAGRHADVFHLPPGRLDEAASLVARVGEAATARGRRGKLRFAMPVDASRFFGDDGAGRHRSSLSLRSEAQRLASVLACYRDLGIGEFVVGGLESPYAIEAFGLHLLPELRTSIQGENRSSDARAAGAPHATSGAPVQTAYTISG